MKYIFFFFFIFILSCSTGKKTYVCGDRTCIDKKEFKEYFAENLTFEIKPKKKDIKNIDLVRLNTTTINKNKDAYLLNAQEKKLKKKEEKAKLKAEMLRLKEERKIKKIIEKKKKKEQKKLVKLNNKEDKKNNLTILKQGDKKSLKTIDDPIVQTNKINKEKITKPEIFQSIKSKNQVSLCDKIQDCDINKIAELLSERNNKKKYPNISAK